VADGLRAWLRIQELVEEVGMPEALEPTGENIRTYMLALLEEVHEFGREINWRPWHEGRPIAVHPALKEYADMMAFMGLLGVYLMKLTGVTPDLIADAYRQVSIDNMTLLKTKRGLEANGPT
jgi:dimeric dUTPase (all-alpha-NTP-PPase superfamily)